MLCATMRRSSDDACTDTSLFLCHLSPTHHLVRTDQPATQLLSSALSACTIGTANGNLGLFLPFSPGVLVIVLTLNIGCASSSRRFTAMTRRAERSGQQCIPKVGYTLRYFDRLTDMVLRFSPPPSAFYRTGSREPSARSLSSFSRGHDLF